MYVTYFSVAIKVITRQPLLRQDLEDTHQAHQFFGFILSVLGCLILLNLPAIFGTLD